MRDTGTLVYVVDDDPCAREGVAALIRSTGVPTKTFASGEEFLAAPLPDMPSCLVLDVNLPGINGLDLQHELVRSGHQVPVIFLTGYGDIPTTVRALRAGATDFLTKPVDEEALLRAIRRCFTSHVTHETGSTRSGPGNECFDQAKTLEPEDLRLIDDIGGGPTFEEIVGRSEALPRVLQQVRVIAPTDSTVLIHGETGTGKELIARAVHKCSARKQGPFVTVNCAAIPDSLLESELFGHEKGSFTGALAQKVGRFELAHGGTLFLDEIGEMPLALQPKLLRVIQDLEFERVGGNHSIRTDARIVAATNRDLKAMVQANSFRADLYYRLNVFPVTLPPLRERREDIPLLARYFVEKHARRMGRKIDTIPGSVLDALTNYGWPGNVRELQNVLERSVILTTGSVLQAPLLELTGKAGQVTLQQGPPAQDLESARGSSRPGRRSERRGGPPGNETDNASIPHAKIQHHAPVSMSGGPRNAFSIS